MFTPKATGEEPCAKPEEPLAAAGERRVMAERRMPVRMCLRPPARFAAGADLNLWLTRFELYVREAENPEAEWKKDVLPLLEDEPFRVVSRLGLVESGTYADVKAQLQRQFAPEGSEFEWQFRLQSRSQKQDEPLTEFAGELRMLAGKAYPKWTEAQRQEIVRNQFIQGMFRRHFSFS